MLISYPQSGVNALHIVFALKIFKLVSNEKSILVEIFDFAVTQLTTSVRMNSCSNFLMEKTQVLFFSNQKDNRICLFKCSTISM